MQFLLTRN